MDLLPTQEQQQIVDTAKHFLNKEFPVGAAVQGADADLRFGRSHLAQIAGLGWLGIGLAEEHGGVGYALPEEALLFVELGCNLMPPSLLGAVLGARLAAASGADEILAGILDGDTVVAVAAARPGASLGATVSGEFLAYEVDDADLLLLADDSGAVLLPVASLEDVEATACIDPLLGAGICRVENATPQARVDAGRDNLFERGSLLTSALMLGIAEATMDRSVAYAKEREQYGKPIGSFQAIKHYCAEMAIRCESVRAMLYHASITLDSADPAGHFDTHTVKALAGDASQMNANTAVQIHGGMGYTEEMDIHLFVKRAQVLATLFGGERHHLRALLHAPRPDREAQQ